MSKVSQKLAQPGLRWRKGLLSSRPEWKAEPSLDVIRKLSIQHLALQNESADTYTIEFFAEGAFNKLFLIACSKGDFIFRVTLPVAPVIKTLSEVATLTFAREKTTIPVPGVIYYDSNLENELGFEWILMERLDGQPLRERWHDLSWLQKQLLVMKIADFVAQLSRIQLEGIGSLFFAYPVPGNAPQAYQISDAVVPDFLIDDHIQLPISRGPFKNSHDLVAAHMAHLQHDITTQLESTDEDEQEDGKEMQEVFTRLAPEIPRLFPPHTTKEPTFLSHRDLSLNNILINNAGDVVGIVDWESIIAAPAWLACQLPQFLTGEPRACPDLPIEEDVETQEFYREASLEYDTAQLRRFFIEEMGRVEPGWVEVFERESTRRDVMLAMDLTSVYMDTNAVRGWIGALGEGREPRVSLTDVKRGGV